MIIQKATALDKAQIFEMHVSLFKGHINEIWGWDNDWQRANFDKEWEDSNTELITHEGDCLGYLQTRLDKDHIYVLSLGILPEFQSIQFGAKAMRVLMNRAAEKQLPIKLNVFKTNLRVIQFYNKLGFEVVGDNNNGVTMRWSPISDCRESLD